MPCQNASVRVCILYMQNEYGIDWNGPTGVDHETVVVPDTENPLSPAQLDLLRDTINPMEECDQYGISLYLATKAFVASYIAQV